MRNIKELARQVKMPYDFVTGEPIYLEKLEAFASLVRAEALAEQSAQQEPVAWIVEFENGEQELHFEAQSVGEKNTPLYTSPPAQPTVPDALTPADKESPKYTDGWNDCRELMLRGRKI